MNLDGKSDLITGLNSNNTSKEIVVSNQNIGIVNVVDEYHYGDSYTTLVSFSVPEGYEVVNATPEKSSGTVSGVMTKDVVVFYDFDDILFVL